LAFQVLLEVQLKEAEHPPDEILPDSRFHIRVQCESFAPASLASSLISRPPQFASFETGGPMATFFVFLV
jgi:hypothetical protein